MITARIAQESYSLDICLPELISKQASSAEAIALVADNETLTYRELNQRANQLAHYLRSLGIGSNMLVGCCLERSPELVIALLGIHKAGAAYVPFDPTYPAERLNFMLHDAHVSLLITKQHLIHSTLPAQTQVIDLDQDAILLNRQSKQDPEHHPLTDDLAYVIYTSGSTGRPKGVQITHRNLLNLIHWHREAFSITSADRASQVTSPAFDATGWEIWPYLTVGACIYFPDEETRITPTLMQNWLLAQKITVSFLPTHLAESVMALDWPPTTPLRLLLTGADTLRHYPAQTLPFELINNYGPTETTVVATSGRIMPCAYPEHLPSIGRPIANTEIYLLDEDLNEVPDGGLGEIYIGGIGVAHGYLNRPELMAERFIQNPFKADPQARLYKTGDLAYALPNGEIIFAGRVDHQVKIRGYRIELDEISFKLNELPMIQTSVVIALDDANGNLRLVAYLILTPQAQVTDQELRTALSQQLPDYMLPSTFVVLDELPLTSNGKIDRTALPPPDATNTLEAQEFTPPTTLVEEQLATIVASLLGMPEVGIDDDFFMLGGHSLLGAQVIMHVDEKFGVKLTLRTLFEAPTVRELAAEIEQQILITLDAMDEDEIQRYLNQGNTL